MDVLFLSSGGAHEELAHGHPLLMADVTLAEFGGGPQEGRAAPRHEGSGEDFRKGCADQGTAGGTGNARQLVTKEPATHGRGTNGTQLGAAPGQTATNDDGAGTGR